MRILLLAALLFPLTVPGAEDSPITLTAIDRGVYTDGGQHDPIKRGYGVGNETAPYQVLRHFFVFNIPTNEVDFTHAKLTLSLPAFSYRSRDNTETLVLSEVTTDLSILRAGGIGLTGIYDDLGDGLTFGLGTISRSDEGGIVTIPLNALFVDYLNEHQGTAIAIAGRLVTLDSDYGTQERLFAGTDSGPLSNTSLTIWAIPEPGTWSLILAGMGMLAMRLKGRIVRRQ